MSQLHTIHEPEALEILLEQSQTQPIIIFKHSNSCPFSAGGHRTMRRLATALAEENDGQHAIYMLVVQQSRALSQTVQDRLEVRHETPQAIIVQQGKAAAVFNHSAINISALSKRLIESPLSSTAEVQKMIDAYLD